MELEDMGTGGVVTDTDTAADTAQTLTLTQQRPPNIANCTGCGKVGPYQVTTSSSSSSSGSSSGSGSKVHRRYKEHIMSAKNSGTGKAKYCGKYTENPRFSDVPPCNSNERDAITAPSQQAPQEQPETDTAAAAEAAAADTARAAARAAAAAVPRVSAPPPLATTFAPGMDPGECTVLACWQTRARAGEGEGEGGLEEADLRELFCPFGAVFRLEVEVDEQRRGEARVFFAERKAALGAVTKFSNYVHVPTSSSDSGVQGKAFSLQASLLGADIYVGGLVRGVTGVKMKRGNNRWLCCLVLCCVVLCCLVLILDSY
jgi:hypothetical protein